MNHTKLQKYVNLAINNSSTAEASTAARMFFKKLKSLDMKFSSKTWGLNKDQAVHLMKLGNVQIKGTKPEEPKNIGEDIITLAEMCSSLNMTPSKARRILRKRFGNAKRWAWNVGHDADLIKSYLSSFIK
ncbi:hypothetical protein [Yersinia phage vB_YenM_P744]